MRFYLFLLFTTASLLANKPFNSNYLVERGIDPDILNNVISSTRQNIAYRIKMHHTITQEKDTEELDYYLIVDPYPSYGTELKIQIAKDNMQKINQSDIQKTLDELMGAELYLQHKRLYDINSFKLLSANQKNTIISFTLKKEAIPRELSYLRNMVGYVYISNGVLQNIVLKNKYRFNMHDIKVDRYEKKVSFKKVKTGGYLVSGIDLYIYGEHKDKIYKETLHGSVVQYWNERRQEVSFQEGVGHNTVVIENTNYQMISLDLDRFFPLLGKDARKAGYDLPKPFGVTLINMFQDTTMHMTSFELDGIDYDFNKVLDGDSIYKSITYAPLIRADIWVLPFVSFSVILGATDTTTNVTLVSDSGLTIPAIIPGRPDIEIIAPGSKINLDPFGTNALLYGLGATVAGGFDNYFTTIDFQYIIAYTEEADVSVDMMIITPLIGYTFSDYYTRIFVGAQYQRLAQSLTFNISDDSGNNISGIIGLESEEWAGVIGTDYSFTRNWSANLLYSQGVDRKNTILGISYRF